MTLLLAARLPLPPTTANHSYLIGGRFKRRVVKSVIVQRYQDDCALELSQVPIDRARIARLRETRQPMRVAMQFYLPTLWRRDLDGMLKIPLDAIFRFLGLNDNRVVQLVSSKHCTPAAVWLDVQVEVIDDEETRKDAKTLD